MSIISYFQGANRGRRVARFVSYMTQHLVNHLVQNGIIVRLPHTVAIFKCVYAYYLFLSFKHNKKPEEYGATIESSKKYLSDWLVEIFQPSDPTFDFRPSIESMMDDIPGYFSQWTYALTENNQSLIGKPVKEWISIAKNKLVEDIKQILNVDFNNLPADLPEVVSTLAEECSTKLGG